MSILLHQPGTSLTNANDILYYIFRISLSSFYLLFFDYDWQNSERLAREISATIWGSDYRQGNLVRDA